MAWCGISGSTGAVPDCRGEERAEPGSKALDQSIYVPTLTYGQELWDVTIGELQAVEMSVILMGWVQPYRHGEELGHLEGLHSNSAEF